MTIGHYAPDILAPGGVSNYIRRLSKAQKEGENGFIVPTGNLEALIERLEHIRAHPMTRTEALIPSRVFL